MNLIWKIYEVFIQCILNCALDIWKVRNFWKQFANSIIIFSCCSLKKTNFCITNSRYILRTRSHGDHQKVISSIVYPIFGHDLHRKIRSIERQQSLKIGRNEIIRVFKINQEINDRNEDQKQTGYYIHLSAIENERKYLMKCHASQWVTRTGWEQLTKSPQMKILIASNKNCDIIKRRKGKQCKFI